VPFAIRKRGGRKLIVTPDGTDLGIAPRHRIDNAMVKAVARAFLWRKLLETGVHGTIEEIAVAEKINASYIGRLLRLTLLAPEIVEAILDGRQPVEMTLAGLMRRFPVSWGEQSLPVDAAGSTDGAAARSRLPVVPALDWRHQDMEKQDQESDHRGLN
jgi:hypothetical protein